jgi:sugar/nucleoside kinase (ribokinase family)
LLVDTILLPEGEAVDSLGGIAYSVAYLAAHAPKDVRVEPVCRVGADLWGELHEEWKQLPAVDPSSLIRDPSPTPRNLLDYRSRGGSGDSLVGKDGRGEKRPIGVGDRSERPTGLLAPLSNEDLAPAEGADLVLVNCITGRDLTLDAMRQLAAACDSVYLDVHSLALGFTADGSRFYRRPGKWRGWIACADIVQCNRAEAATLAGRDAFAHDPAEVEDFLAGLLLEADERGDGIPRVIALTEGAKGATVLWREGDRVRRERASAPSVEVVDPTGAGDAFGAGFALEWQEGASPPESALRGVLTGAVACTVAGIPAPTEVQKAVETLGG